MLHNVFNEFSFNGYDYNYVLLISLTSIFFGVSVIITKNPVISILFLIGLFVTISIYLMLLGMYFMGLAYLLVYVGAISILFIFIIMLISVRVSELTTENKNSIPLAILIIFSFNFSMNSVSAYYLDMINTFYDSIYAIYKTMSLYLSSTTYNLSMTHFDISENTYKLANVTSKSWDSSLIENNHITSIGNILYTNLFILLIIISMILLVAMIGAIVITITKKTSSTLIN